MFFITGLMVAGVFICLAGGKSVDTITALGGTFKPGMIHPRGWPLLVFTACALYCLFRYGPDIARDSGQGVGRDADMIMGFFSNGDR